MIARVIMILSVSLALFASEESSIDKKLYDTVISDVRLIVPGYGAEKAVIGSEINEFLARTRRVNYKISKPAKPGEIFADIFKIETKYKIYFDTIYTNEDSGSVVFVLNKKITAVSGLSSERYTADKVNLKDGVENFLFNYGSRGLEKFESSISRMYQYHSVGIAVFDDNKNDTIDLYLVFPAGRGEGR